MIRCREFERALEPLCPIWSASTIDQHTRRLRAAGLLPKGGRGLNAPAIGAAEAATILISLAAATRPDEAADVVPIYRALELHRSSRFFANAPDFGARLNALLSDPAIEIERVLICQTWPAATICLGDREHQFRSPHPRPFDAVWTGTTFPGALLKQIAALVTDG